MFLSGFVRPSVWSSFFRVKDKKIPGNMQGEGRLLGGKLFSPEHKFGSNPNTY